MTLYLYARLVYNEQVHGYLFKNYDDWYLIMSEQNFEESVISYEGNLVWKVLFDKYSSKLKNLYNKSHSSYGDVNWRNKIKKDVIDKSLTICISTEGSGLFLALTNRNLKTIELENVNGNLYIPEEALAVQKSFEIAEKSFGDFIIKRIASVEDKIKTNKDREAVNIETEKQEEEQEDYFEHSEQEKSFRSYLRERNKYELEQKSVSEDTKLSNLLNEHAYAKYSDVLIGISTLFFDTLYLTGMKKSIFGNKLKVVLSYTGFNIDNKDKSFLKEKLNEELSNFNIDVLFFNCVQVNSSHEGFIVTMLISRGIKHE